MLTWAEKLADAEMEQVASFLSKTTCGCAHKCIQKIRNLQDAGVNMVCDLRDSRLAGESHVTCCYTRLQDFPPPPQHIGKFLPGCN